MHEVPMRCCVLAFALVSSVNPWSVFGQRPAIGRARTALHRLALMSKRTLAQGCMSGVLTVDRDKTSVRIVEPLQESHDGGLPKVRHRLVPAIMDKP